MRSVKTEEHIFDVPLQWLYTIRCKLEHVDATISNEAIICRRCYRNPIVEPRGIFDCIALEALCSVFEHVARSRDCGLDLDFGPVILCLLDHIMGGNTLSLDAKCTSVPGGAHGPGC